jgi:hypothetical protein
MTTDKEEQEERRRTVLNDARVRAQQGGTTFSSFADAFANEDRQGRYQTVNKATVIGADAIPKYEGAPNWANDPVGMEPPFPLDVSEQQPTGEPHEVRASIAAHDVSLEPSLLPGGQGNSGDLAAAPSDASSLGAERAGSPPFLKNKG